MTSDVIGTGAEIQVRGHKREGAFVLLLDTLLVFAGSLGFLGFGIGRLEFFRHTEADRSLISWEMLERGEFLVPHLLGSPILTKPPLFYWLQVLSFQWYGEISETSARLPSLLFASIACAGFYACLRVLSYNRPTALCVVLVLATSSQFFILSRVAEIDMCYGALSWFALLALYFSECRRRQGLRCAAYALLGLAFLAKGPETAVFFLLLAPLLRLSFAKEPIDKSWLLAHFSASLLFFLPIALWLIALAGETGWDALLFEFRHEVLARALEDSERQRGLLFYVLGLPKMFAPWSFILLVLLVLSWWQAGSLLRSGSRVDTPPAADLSVTAALEEQGNFFRYSVLVVLLALLTLSFSQGKSYRYFFPVHLFAAHICGLLIIDLFTRIRLRRIRETLRNPVLCGAAILSLVAYAVLAVLLEAEVSRASLGLICVAGFLSLACFVVALTSAERRAYVVAILVLICFCRLVYAGVYIPHRNAHRSVHSIALELRERVPQEHTLYTLEMFERWVLFYYRSYGGQAKRIGPAEAAQLASTDARVYLLLNEEEEAWRLAEVLLLEPSSRLLLRLEDPRDPLLLVETSASIFQHMNLQKRFPSERSLPNVSKSFVQRAHAL